MIVLVNICCSAKYNTSKESITHSLFTTYIFLNETIVLQPDPDESFHDSVEYFKELKMVFVTIQSRIDIQNDKTWKPFVL